MYCTEGSRSSQSLASIPAKVVRSADSRSQQLRRIVVVAEGQPSRPAVDADVRRLSAVPAFTPLLHGTVSLSDDTVSSRPPQLDARHVLALCTRYQDHLHQCAEAVAFDQNALCVHIKEVSRILTFWQQQRFPLPSSIGSISATVIVCRIRWKIVRAVYGRPM